MFKLKKLGLFRKTPNRYYVQKSKESDTKIEVDSELSITSENPVQNKIITEALADKQDSLPNTTGQTDKFLKVGSNGLEWAEAGGKLYRHYITGHVVISTKMITFQGLVITNKSDAYTKQTLATFLDTGGTAHASLLINVQMISSGLPYIMTDFELRAAGAYTDDIDFSWAEITYANNTFTHLRRSTSLVSFKDEVVEL